MNFIKLFFIKRKIKSFYKRTLFMYEILSDDLFIDALLQAVDFSYSVREQKWHDELFGFYLSSLLLDTSNKSPDDCLEIFLMMNNLLKKIECECKENLKEVDEDVAIYDYIRVCGLRFLMIKLANRFEKMDERERLLLTDKMEKCNEELIQERVNNYIDQKTMLEKIIGLKQPLLNPDIYYNQVYMWILKGKININY